MDNSQTVDAQWTGDDKAPVNRGTGFVESELLLAIIAGDEETVQYYLRTMSPGAREALHRHAEELKQRTHRDARPEDAMGIRER